MDNSNRTLVVNVDDGHVKFSSNMDDETVWTLLAMSLVSQSYKLGLDKISAHELLDFAWQRVEKQKAKSSCNSIEHLL